MTSVTVNDMAIETVQLTRRFGDVVAVNEVTVGFPTGRVIGLVGPNGSGKSTLIRTVLGLIAPSSGTGSVLGEPIDAPERYADRVGALIENPSFIETMSARANLESLARLRGLSESRIDAVLDLVGLSGRDADKVSTFSLGMKQRLGIAAAMLPDPALLILDEPNNGLDPSGIVEMRRLLKALAAEGRTIVVSSHLLGELQALCDYLVVIRYGVLLYDGDLHQFLHRSQSVIATPEHRDDVAQLCEHLIENGLDATTRDQDVVVVVASQEAATISKLGAQVGIFLRSLVVVDEGDLESAFLALTGEEADNAAARHRGGAT